MNWYKFNEIAGVNCNDFGIDGLDGEYNDVLINQDGAFGPGEAVRFDRSGNNIILFEGGTDLTGTWTAVYIVKLMSRDSFNSQVLHDSHDNGIKLVGYSAEGDVAFTKYFVADYRYTPVSGNRDDLLVPVGEWLQIAYRRDDVGESQVFFNGVLTGTSTDSIDFPRASIGIRDTGSDKLDAFIDEAVVFDTALSDLAIASISLLHKAIASNPSPANNAPAVDPGIFTALQWDPPEAYSVLAHDVYFGTDPSVIDNPKVIDYQNVTEYIPSYSLDYGTPYYWRVDSYEPNEVGQIRHIGNKWSFTTEPGYVLPVIPTPISVGIDDVGWKRGWSTADTGGPWRGGTAVGRWMVWEDYEVLKYIGETVKTRLQSLFVMSEFDRSNICAEYPTTTQEGSSWDNSALVSDDDFTIMNYVKDQSAYIEFGLHGVGHEHWDDGVKTRAEFSNQPDNNSPWPFSVVWGHMECFDRIIDQYGLTFPKSFVPPSHAYYYNPSDPNDTGGLMAQWGVKYGVQLTTHMTNHDLVVLPRIFHVGWNQTSVAPTTVASGYYYEGSHWTNFVEPDPADNHIAGDKWISWFNQIKDLPERYLPKNTAQLYSQYFYKNHSSFQIEAGHVYIDNTSMPDWVYNLDLLGNLILKIPLEAGEHISAATLNGGNIACYYEDRDFGYMVLPRMDQSNHVLTYTVGPSKMTDYVLNDGTYNVDSFELSPTGAIVSVEMYGSQDITIKLDMFEPVFVRCSTDDLIINSAVWDDISSTLTVNVTASDAQGVSGEIAISANPIGDINTDGKVNIADFAILSGQWLGAPGEPSADIAPSLIGDGTVDMQDLVVLTEQWLW